MKMFPLNISKLINKSSFSLTGLDLKPAFWRENINHPINQTGHTYSVSISFTVLLV